MAELRFSPEADLLLSVLESNDLPCAGKLNTALDALERDPSAAANRRHRFQHLDGWGISVRCRDEDWLILWEYLQRDPDVVVVRHIVPSP